MHWIKRNNWVARSLKEINKLNIVKKSGSGALSGKIMDSGLLKNFSSFLFLDPVGSSNPAGPYPYLLPNPVGQSLPLETLT